ncbi:MAG: hypothetical protein ABR601_03610 [Parasphingopyxis sp.]|nr:hypothetical protein [Sphingomonadales bacterium]
MTFHEKSRWIALAANLLVWGWYFVIVVRALGAGYPDEPYLLGAIIGVIVAMTVIHVVLHVAVAVWNPAEARSEMDERDRAISNRAGARAFDLLSLGLVIALGASLYHWNTFVAINAVLFAFILADTARYALEIVAYRRGLA